MEHIELQRLSKDELIDLVLNLQRPLNNSNDSSTRPSTDKKVRRESSRPGNAKPGHAPQLNITQKTLSFVITCQSILSAVTTYKFVIQQWN
ncbi:hypothetical protein ACI0FM_14885 [Paenochrobactrum sp. BZR 588]|uniref:hypothetical protein n=1 Tax=unclassified Paenochrobactrum TaxID=2639760 RepID=UPI003852FCF3